MGVQVFTKKKKVIMSLTCKYIHTNLTVLDIEKMKDFYVNVFGCIPVRETQALSGEWISKITSVEGGEIIYVHLRLPGHDKGAPELELIQYKSDVNQFKITANTVGFGHIAFSVSNVNEVLSAVVKAGGGSIGEVVTVDVPSRGRLTEVYATDPEGNILELQSYE